MMALDMILYENMIIYSKRIRKYFLFILKKLDYKNLMHKLSLLVINSS